MLETGIQLALKRILNPEVMVTSPGKANRLNTQPQILPQVGTGTLIDLSERLEQLNKFNFNSIEESRPKPKQTVPLSTPVAAQAQQEDIWKGYWIPENLRNPLRTVPFVEKAANLPVAGQALDALFFLPMVGYEYASKPLKGLAKFSRLSNQPKDLSENERYYVNKQQELIDKDGWRALFNPDWYKNYEEVKTPFVEDLALSLITDPFSYLMAFNPIGALKIAAPGARTLKGISVAGKALEAPVVSKVVKEVGVSSINEKVWRALDDAARERGEPVSLLKNQMNSELDDVEKAVLERLKNNKKAQDEMQGIIDQIRNQAKERELAPLVKQSKEADEALSLKLAQERTPGEIAAREQEEVTAKAVGIQMQKLRDEATQKELQELTKSDELRRLAKASREAEGDKTVFGKTMLESQRKTGKQTFEEVDAATKKWMAENPEKSIVQKLKGKQESDLSELAGFFGLEEPVGKAPTGVSKIGAIGKVPKVPTADEILAVFAGKKVTAAQAKIISKYPELKVVEGRVVKAVAPGLKPSVAPVVKPEVPITPKVTTPTKGSVPAIREELSKMSDKDILALGVATKRSVAQTLGMSGRAEIADIDNFLLREARKAVTPKIKFNKPMGASKGGLAIMEYKTVAPVMDEVAKDKIMAAYKKIKSPVGYASYTALKNETGLPYETILGVLKQEHLSDPKSIHFDVDRMGKNVFFKFNPEAVTPKSKPSLVKTEVATKVGGKFQYPEEFLKSLDEGLTKEELIKRLKEKVIPYANWTEEQLIEEIDSYVKKGKLKTIVANKKTYYGGK